MPGAPDVVVAGGGVIGLSAAWELAGRGLRVCVVDPEPGKGAGWVAAGILSPLTEASLDNRSLAGLFLAAAGRWPQFAERLSDSTGVDVGFQTCGSVAVARSATELATVEQLLDAHHELGLAATRLSGPECRERLPLLSPDVEGGAFIPGDHQVDNRAVLHALVEGCRRAGVDCVAARVEAVGTDSTGAASYVVTTGGTVHGGAVLLAAGTQTPRIAGVPEGVVPAVHPVNGHVVRLRAAHGQQVFCHTVRGTVDGRHCYLVPRRDGSVVLGATSEERGDDTQVRAGALHTLLADGRTLVPALDHWEVLECTAGLRPRSADGVPIVGPTTVARLYTATGHYRNGFLLAPITAEALADSLTGGDVPAALRLARPDRRVRSRARAT